MHSPTLPGRFRRWLETHPDPILPDLDAMTLDQIREWLDSIPRGTRTGEASHAFPGKPPGYLVAFNILRYIAHCRIKGRPYEMDYRRLPFWAKWRNRLPVAACVLPGKEFRRTQKRSNPLDLLKGLEN